jgi:hypothetical protein
MLVDFYRIKYPTCLYWQSAATLLVGKGHFVKTATVKEVDRNFQKLSQYSGEVDPNRKKKIMAIVGQNIFPNSIVCGVVPIFDENDWKLVKTFQRVKEALRIVLCCIGLPKIALVAD